MTDQTKGYLFAVLGVLVLSPDTMCVRLLDLDQWTLQFYRGLGVGCAILAYMAATHGRNTPSALLAVGFVGLLAAAGFSASTVLFISSLYLTSVANTLAIISASPLFGAVISWLILRERLPLRTWAAAFLAIGCVGIIVSQDIGDGALAGDLLALGQSVCWAASFVLVRQRKDVNMVPCMGLAGFLTAGFALLWGPELAVPTGKIPLLLLLAGALLPLSFGCITAAPRWISAPEVSMTLQLEMILGPLLVWGLVGEPVPEQTMLGGGLLFGVLTAHSLLGVRKARLDSRIKGHAAS